MNSTSIIMNKNDIRKTGGKPARPVFGRTVQNKSGRELSTGLHKPVSTPGLFAQLDKLVLEVAAAGRALNLTVIYEDPRTQNWAGEVCEWVKRCSGVHGVRPMWWKLDNLSEPGVLAGAVSTAIRADIIVVCTLATEGLPLPFYVWVNAWLAQRRQAPGALVALLGMPEESAPSPGRVKEYLRAVASQSRMALLVKERRFAIELPMSVSIRHSAHAFSRLTRLILGRDFVRRPSPLSQLS